MRHIFPLLLASSALLASSPLENRIETLELQMKDLRMQSVYGNYGARTATAYPNLNSWGVFVATEAIYWKFFEGGTDYAFSVAPTQGGTIFSGQMNDLDFAWRPAFRVIAGYQLSDPDWNVQASYTRFTTSQTAHVEGTSTNSLFPNQSLRENPDYTGANERWKIHYNVFDLNLGRAYFLRHSFSAHPFFGIRGAKINQHYTIEWNGSTTSDYTYKARNDFSGLGIALGTQGRWHFTKNWSLFSSVLGSLLYGWYAVDTTLYQIYPSSISLLNLASNLRRVVPNMTADAGFRWECNAFRARTCFSISAAYEFQYWWAQNQTLHTDQAVLYLWNRWNEDFGMQGIKLDVGLNF